MHNISVGGARFKARGVRLVGVNGEVEKAQLATKKLFKVATEAERRRRGGGWGRVNKKHAKRLRRTKVGIAAAVTLF